MQRKRLWNQGFTVLEMILIIAGISVLIGIVVFIINPGKQVSESRNSERQEEINDIILAVYKYALEHEGRFPENISSELREICDISGEECRNLVDLGVLFSEKKYLEKIPVDPKGFFEHGVGYKIRITDDGKITVTAPLAENGETIEITR
ncbi:type II secretion system protein [Candidatus Peregrinibacteria bacterium]|nr:type II secretion system protein [Candidatus Peregrinibacteria bacterium]